MNSLLNQKVLGATLLVAGCCIGAGMLGLPLVTAASGFLPTLIAFPLSWLFMAVTGLLLLEANLWFGRGVNLMTLSEKTLGKGAKVIVTFLFLFLFYCINVAYISGGGAILSEMIEHMTGISVSPGIGSILFTLGFGIIIFLGTHAVDLLNRGMMVGLIISFILLVIIGLSKITLSNLAIFEWDLIYTAFPAMIISFGYHNLVPSLTDYLEGEVKKIRFAILVGSFIPLIVYLIWDGIILGILPYENGTLSSIDEGVMITRLMDTSEHGFVTYTLQAFSFLALATSFIAVALSFVDFLADGLKIKKTMLGSLALVSMVIFPPLLFAFIYPALFLTALNYAGAFGAVILFGVIPVLMVWKGRYIDLRGGARLVPGGRITLAIVGLFAFFVFCIQLKNELGV